MLCVLWRIGFRGALSAVGTRLSIVIVPSPVSTVAPLMWLWPLGCAHAHFLWRAFPDALRKTKNRTFVATVARSQNIFFRYIGAACYLVNTIDKKYDEKKLKCHDVRKKRTG